MNLSKAFRQPPQRVEKSLGIQDECGEGAQSHRATGHHPATDGKHRGNGPKGNPLQEGGNTAVEKNRPIDGLAISRTGLGKPLAIHLFTTEHLNDFEALKVFLKVSVELGELLSNAIVGLAVTTLQPKNNEGDRNLRAEQQQAQPPLDQQHRGGNDQQADQVAENTDCTAPEHLSQRINITGEAGQQLAHRHAVVEPQRQ